MALGRFHPVELPVQGNVAVTADAMRNGLEQREARCIDHRDEVAALADQAHRKGVARAMIVARASMPPRCSMPCDSCRATQSSASTSATTPLVRRYFEAADSVLMSGYLGSIGFSFPASGAWAAVGHERPIVSVSGDDGFGQYAMEFTTAVKYDMNITVLMNNSQLGKISKEQRAAHFDVWQTSLVNPSFAECRT